jgi:tetratricopeptide (TPR) repeat protein
MTRMFSKLVLGTALVILVNASDVSAGRGGGGGGGGRGGGGYGGGNRSGGGGMGGSPSFSQPRQQSGNRSQSGNSAGAAAAGAGYSNHNQSQSHPAGAAAAGAGYSNRNQSQSHPAGAAAAGAGYANHNQSQSHPAGAAAAGAGYANNQGLAHPGAVGAAAGAGYANQYHPGMVNGTWSGNGYGAWGATGYGAGYGYGTGVGAWGIGSPMYGWGYSGYSNPYSAGYAGAGGVAQNVAAQQAAAAPYNYSQPLSTTAAPPEQAVASQSASALDQARDAFKAGDYGNAAQLDQQALAQTPNDTTLHEFLGLVYFAQGKYDQAAGPLYAVLSVGPGWDWTTVCGMYPDVETYTRQLRALEASVRANPDSAPARFVLAYQYLVQGHDQNAVEELKAAVKLQPGDTLSAQLIAHHQPTGSALPASADAALNAAPADLMKLAGSWIATPAKDTNVSLAIKEDGKFSWDVSSAGKPSTTISGASTLADGVLTLAAQGTPDGALAGKVAWLGADSFTFRLVGASANDPGLKFAR